MTHSTIHYDQSQVEELRSKIVFIIDNLGFKASYDKDCLESKTLIFQDDKIKIIVQGGIDSPNVFCTVMIFRHWKKWIWIPHTDEISVFKAEGSDIFEFRPGKWQGYIDKLFDKAKDEYMDEQVAPSSPSKSFAPVQDDDIFC